VQEEGRQKQNRYRVAPIEDPVEPIETAAERKREEAEKRNREPEEVQRRWIARPAETHGASDEQREDANACEQKVKRTGAARNRRDADVHELASAEAKDGVARRGAWHCRVQRLHHVRDVVDRAVVNREQQVAGAQPRFRRRRGRGDIGGHHALGAELPQHAVLQLFERRARHDVGKAEPQQHRHDDRWQCRMCPACPLSRTIGSR
jgi:hypothetical protein